MVDCYSLTVRLSQLLYCKVQSSVSHPVVKIMDHVKQAKRTPFIPLEGIGPDNVIKPAQT